jgi:protein-tyrosine phosphatase
VGAVAAPERSLAWDGCFNVRDLGGLETAAGGRTRHGTVVRSDNVRRLTARGWDAALAHGVRRVVDLRFENEEPGEPDAHEAVEVFALPLHGPHRPADTEAFEQRLSEADDVAPVFTAGYIRMLERSDRVGAAVAAVADADPEHCVVVHCFAGKDRTGLVSAILLSLAGVTDEVVAADYAASDPGVAHLCEGWFASAGSAAERELRRRLCSSPEDAMLGALGWLRESAGGAERYLRTAGLDEQQIERLRLRLLAS